MNHSFVYYDLKKQIKAVGYERKDGYDREVLEKVYDWERDEVEEIIWNKFPVTEDLYQFFKRLYFKCETIHSSVMQEIIRGLLRYKKDNIKSFGITREDVEKGFNLITEFEVYGKVAKKEMINKLENMQKLDFRNKK